MGKTTINETCATCPYILPFRAWYAYGTSIGAKQDGWDVSDCNGEGVVACRNLTQHEAEWIAKTLNEACGLTIREWVEEER